MQVELNCPCCAHRFAAPPEATSTEVMDRMVHDGGWYFLGDGDTFEDMIFATLTAQGDITCPRCDSPVQVSEETLGQMAMEVLSQW